MCHLIGDAYFCHFVAFWFSNAPFEVEVLSVWVEMVSVLRMLLKYNVMCVLTRGLL